MNKRFLPICRQDVQEMGWDGLDIILITGDAYVDHPSYGAAIIGRVLENAGFRVGIIAHPDWKKSEDFLRFGKPRLFFGITAGNMDSILANYTINRSKRKQDDYSPGGKIGMRPNRATIVYANKVREIFPDTPIILGGIEASIRRLAHYDYWSGSIRRSILIDSKADMLLYGMAESQILEIAEGLGHGRAVKDINGIRGSVIVRSHINDLKDYVIIPSFEEVKSDKDKFNKAFMIFYSEQNPFRGRTVVQKHGDRFIIQFPPTRPLTTQELDKIYLLNYARSWHPVYDKDGGVPGFETVKNSIISHRGCSGECSFCSLGIHQGRIIQSRSSESMLKEIESITKETYFKGTITDIGGPTANLYAASCDVWERKGACKDKKCLMPSKCRNLKLGYNEMLNLWQSAKKIKGVKHVFISSGLRHDLLTDKYSDEYLKALCREHVSGYLKVAPEHTNHNVLGLMNKPSIEVYEKFVKRFHDVNKKLGKRQFIVNYFITSHPGCDLKIGMEMATYFSKRHMRPEQIQDFIPLPMTLSTAMYWTGKNPVTGKKLHIAKDIKERKRQRFLIQPKTIMAHLSRQKAAYERKETFYI